MFVCGPYMSGVPSPLQTTAVQSPTVSHAVLHLATEDNEAADRQREMQNEATRQTTLSKVEMDCSLLLPCKSVFSRQRYTVNQDAPVCRA
jgi:hypothetical protein